MNSSLEENNTISSIDIGQCEDLLRIENNIPSNESLLISKIDIQEDNAIIPKVEYRLYDSQGTELNMSTCNGVPILISYPLINTDLIAKFEDAGTLSEQGLIYMTLKIASIMINVPHIQMELLMLFYLIEEKIYMLIYLFVTKDVFMKVLTTQQIK